MSKVQNVFLIGAKSLGAYGGYETFVYNHMFPTRFIIESIVVLSIFSAFLKSDTMMSTIDYHRRLDRNKYSE